MSASCIATTDVGAQHLGAFFVCFFASSCCFCTRCLLSISFSVYLQPAPVRIWYSMLNSMLDMKVKQAPIQCPSTTLSGSTRKKSDFDVRKSIDGQVGGTCRSYRWLRQQSTCHQNCRSSTSTPPRGKPKQWNKAWLGSKSIHIDQQK